jgi:hypothetical protein
VSLSALVLVCFFAFLKKARSLWDVGRVSGKSEMLEAPDTHSARSGMASESSDICAAIWLQCRSGLVSTVVSRVRGSRDARQDHVLVFGDSFGVFHA